MSDQVAREPGRSDSPQRPDRVRRMLPFRTTAVIPRATASRKEEILTALTETRIAVGSPGTEAAFARTADLMEAMVAAYALMAHADGEAAAAERRRMLAILSENRALSLFSRDDLVRAMAEHEANYRYDPEVAQEIAREKLALVKDRPRAVAAVLDACRELIPADGIAHPGEYRALAAVKVLLGAMSDTSLSEAGRSRAGMP